MDKINFVNLPSTTTPLNATNLNQMQTNIDTGKVETEANRVDNVDANNYIKSGFYYLGTGCSNVPQDYIRLMVSGSSTSTEICQFAMSSVGNQMYIRHKAGGSWTDWIFVGYQTVQIKNANLNTVLCGFYYCNACTNTPTGSNGYLISYQYTASYVKQLYFLVNGSGSYERVCANGAWTDWVKVMTNTNIAMAANVDFDTLTIQGTYFEGSTPTGNNKPPVNAAGLLEVFVQTSFIIQRYTPFTADKTFIRGKYSTNAWTNWMPIGAETIIDRVTIASYLENSWSSNGFCCATIFPNGTKTLTLSVRNGTSTQVMTLPASLRPTGTNVLAQAGSNSVSGYLTINATSGIVTISNNIFTSGAGNLFCSVTYY